MADADAETVANAECEAGATEADADAAAELTGQPRAENSARTDPAPTRRAPRRSEPVASPVESALRSRLCHPRLATFIARGSRHRPGNLPSCPQAPKPILVPMRQGYLYDQFTELLATCPELADGLHPDGHGGWPPHHPAP